MSAADSFVSSSPHMACDRTRILLSTGVTAAKATFSGLSALTLRRCGVKASAAGCTGDTDAKLAPISSDIIFVVHQSSTRVSGMAI